MGKKFGDISLAEIQKQLVALKLARNYLEMHEGTQTFAELVNQEKGDLPKLFIAIKQVHEFVTLLEKDDVTAIQRLFGNFEQLLATLDIFSDNIGDLKKLSSTHPIEDMIFFLLANKNRTTYFIDNTPAMPLPFWYAHFGGFFYARRYRA